LLVVTYLAYFAEILPIFFYLLFLKRNKGEGLWVIFLYCVLSLITEGIFLTTSVQLVFSGFIVVQFGLFSYYFYSAFEVRNFKYIALLGAIVFVAVAIANLSNEHFNWIAESLASILVIIYCILSLYEQIKDPETVFVYQNKKFWVIIALFIYFSSTLFLYLYSTTLSTEQRHMYWAINNFFEILKNILFSVSFIMKKHHSSPTNMEYIDN
jgi:uncharacterized membrane protein